MPKWLGQFTAPGRPLAAADIHPFLIEQPLVKLPYITGGEVTGEDIQGLIERASRLTFTP